MQLEPGLGVSKSRFAEQAPVALVRPATLPRAPGTVPRGLGGPIGAHTAVFLTPLPQSARRTGRSTPRCLQFLRTHLPRPSVLPVPAPGPASRLEHEAPPVVAPRPPGRLVSPGVELEVRDLHRPPAPPPPPTPTPPGTPASPTSPLGTRPPLTAVSTKPGQDFVRRLSEPLLTPDPQQPLRPYTVPPSPPPVPKSPVPVPTLSPSPVLYPSLLLSVFPSPSLPPLCPSLPPSFPILPAGSSFLYFPLFLLSCPSPAVNSLYFLFLCNSLLLLLAVANDYECTRSVTRFTKCTNVESN